jgi:hypothetical protein
MKWKYILLVAMLVCSIGIVSAGNITLFTDADTTAAQKTITGSGVGYVIALVCLVFQYTVWIIPIVLGLAAMILKALHKTELYKATLTAFLVVVAILLAIQLYSAVVVGMIPDISTIEL